MIDFGRTIRIRIGPSGSKGRDFLSTQSGGGPRLNFKASRTSAREPNTLTAKLYNLAPESRAFIEREGASVVVDAGYGKRVSTFFAGDVARAWSARENGVDWVTNIEGGDGEFLFRDAKFSRSFAVGTSSDVIFGSIAGAFGLPLGFVSPRARRVEKVFPRGWSFSGMARDALDELLNDLDLVWSIQDGELVVTGEKDGTSEEAVVVRAENLTEPPAPIVENGEVVGVRLPLKLNSLCRPERILDVKLRDFAGLYRVTKVDHEADSGFEASFNSTCDTKAIEAA